MKTDPSELIDGYFDDVLTAEQHKILSGWIKSDPENAKAFARAALLHNHLREAMVSNASSDDNIESTKSTLSTNWHRLVSSAPVWSAAASAAILLLVLKRQADANLSKAYFSSTRCYRRSLR